VPFNFFSMCPERAFYFPSAWNPAATTVVAAVVRRLSSFVDRIWHWQAGRRLPSHCQDPVTPPSHYPLTCHHLSSTFSHCMHHPNRHRSTTISDSLLKCGSLGGSKICRIFMGHQLQLRPLEALASFRRTSERKDAIFIYGKLNCGAPGC